ncbi:MAG TPA: response regulator transcription factor [Vicinamibacterales bacterium]|nr:response regulator transcription factor [Vicinamibacterales bacterium]
MTDSGPIRVMLAGDCPLLRSGFRQVLEAAGIAVVGSVDTAAEAVALLAKTTADVVVVGAVTGHGGGADARDIRASHPAIPLLVLGRSGDVEGVRAALTAGARGYLGLEGAADGDLIQAVRSLAAGEMYLSPELALSHAAAAATSSRPAPAPVEARLTERERQVLTLVARGRSNREIAEILGLSANTIAVHRANLMKTLAVRKTAALVLYAVRHGLVTAD